eukprot:1561619-Prymnesium_polylepis.1
MYMCDRLRSVVQRVKWSKTEEQRQDYHVIMTSTAPRRAENDTDPDGMIERVADELGVKPGKKCARGRTNVACRACDAVSRVIT